jgi:AcrR family transcriptional regulator
MLGMALSRRRAIAPEAPTRERILRTAGRLFYERGYPTTSTKLIAAGAGVTPAALYWHFPSKAAILWAFLHTEMEDFITAVEAASRTGSAKQRLRDYVREHVMQSIGRLELGPFGANYGLQQLAKFLPPEQQNEIKLWLRRHTGNLAAILGAGIDSGDFSDVDITLTAYAITTMCGYVTIWYRAGGRLTPTEVAERYAALAADMVSAR